MSTMSSPAYLEIAALERAQCEAVAPDARRVLDAERVGLMAAVDLHRRWLRAAAAAERIHARQTKRGGRLSHQEESALAACRREMAATRDGDYVMARVREARRVRAMWEGL